MMNVAVVAAANGQQRCRPRTSRKAGGFAVQQQETFRRAHTRLLSPRLEAEERSPGLRLYIPASVGGRITATRFRCACRLLQIKTSPRFEVTKQEAEETAAATTTTTAAKKAVEGINAIKGKTEACLWVESEKVEALEGREARAMLTESAAWPAPLF